MITLRDVARKAGVGYGTASRALSGRGSVSAATREKVLDAARELGFQRNAAASLLREQGRRLPAEANRIRIARIARRDALREGFDRVCADMGLDGETVDPSEFKNPEHLLRSLYAQGFSGIFLDPQILPWSEAACAAADWSRFSVVKWKRHDPRLQFHLVRHSAFDYIRLALRKSLESGVRKLAVILRDSGSVEDEESRLGALLVARDYWTHENQTILWRTWQSKGAADPDPDTLAWLEREKPDGILLFVSATAYALRDAGWRFPRDARLFAIVHDDQRRDPDFPPIAGNLRREDEVYRLALATLGKLIARGERGFAANPTEQVVRPVWVEERRD